MKFVGRLVKETAKIPSLAEEITITPHCSTGGAGSNLGLVSWGWWTYTEFALCWRLHSAQMQWAQNNQWECEQQPEGQEGPSPQSHGAASALGKGERTTHTQLLIVQFLSLVFFLFSSFSPYFSSHTVIFRLRSGLMRAYTCWHLSQ